MTTKKAPPMPDMTSDSPRRPALRGFAAMDVERRREIARKGGQSVPDEKRSFAQDRTLAAEAGRKGGRRTQSGRKTLAQG
jgi:general stress protein YciG